MTEVFYTSDPHIGHRLMAEKRGFNGDVEAHDAALAEAWDRVVTKRDIVYILGDLTMSTPLKGCDWIQQRPGEKRLIWGNHDSGHPMHRPTPAAQRFYLDNGFASVDMAGYRKLAGIRVLLSHFPYDADREEYESSRFPQWRLPNLGEWLLHGHTHLPEKHTGVREIHVGVDAWDLTPVPQPTIEGMIRMQLAVEQDIFESGAFS